jgi:drug/metabolite transporter (DMT)-like permease
MFDSIPSDQYLNLIYRIINGTLGMFTSYFAIAYFPLVLVSLVTNITPLLVAVFSYIFYRVGLSKTDTIILIVSFLGVAILITGSTSEEQ